MKSVGETMAIGSTFKESFQKALRGLEVRSDGFGCDRLDLWGTDAQPSKTKSTAKLSKAGAERVWYLRYAIKSGMSTRQDQRAHGHRSLVPRQSARNRRNGRRCSAASGGSTAVTDEQLRTAKRQGFSDRQLAQMLGRTESEVRADRLRRGIRATFKSVDTCAAEFEAYTPYYYSTYEDEDEVPSKKQRAESRESRVPKHRHVGSRPPTLGPPPRTIMILGGGPNRIGQGIEFDYCCCHASFALRELGIESVMVNSNPETVSTDYDTSDMLFFEPLTVEDVLNICDVVEPDGVIVQFGGQTPLNLARRLKRPACRSSAPASKRSRRPRIARSFNSCSNKLGLKQPPNGIARTMDEARREAEKIGYPLLVRPSFVLGGRAMEICYDPVQLERFVAEAFIAAEGQPVLIDRFLGRGDRGRRRLHRRRHGRDHRRHHGAHRRGGRPLGRFGLCDSALQPARASGGRKSARRRSRWPGNWASWD